jgi:prophage tail gpP-like protein
VERTFNVVMIPRHLAGKGFFELPLERKKKEAQTKRKKRKKKKGKRKKEKGKRKSEVRCCLSFSSKRSRRRK